MLRMIGKKISINNDNIVYIKINTNGKIAAEATIG